MLKKSPICPLFLYLFLCSFPILVFGQKGQPDKEIPKDILKYDTISFPAGIYFISPTDYYFFPKDTTLVITSFRKIRSEEANELRSQTLYDTIFRKFAKSKLSKLLYNLAFVSPNVSSLPDTIQTQKIEVPFLPYQGMYIREVHIKSLDPFGATIFDTTGQAQTALGRFGNQFHINTHVRVIQNQLMFRKGQRLNAEKIADNMRLLQELPYIDDARIVVTEIAPGSDTVDVTVITKDNWSIGATVAIVELTSYRGSLYDANFLGSGDRLSVFWSMNNSRAPFFRFDGLSYNFTNISGSFIDGIISLTQDDDGNQTLYTGLSRPFFSYSTRLAGGLNFTLAKTVVPLSDTLTQVASYHQEGAWLGISSPLNSSTPATRFVVAQSVQVRRYLSRPEVTIDSNIGYYNSTTILTGLQISKNKYYNTDYILQFGKMESFPYGFLGQLTAGPSITDFYTRFYMNAGASGGNFINKFGYLYGSINLGGYLNRDAFEDGLLKCEAQYMSYLYHSRSKRFKFRSYVSFQFNCQFNERENNRDFYDLADEARIRSVTTDSLLTGNKVAFLSFSTVAYAPWYFYGFRFALQGTVWGGLSAPKERSLLDSPFMTGIGVGLLFKNDNLIFPTIMISCFVYPTTPGVPFIQFDMFETSSYDFRDFSPTAPYVQTMRN